MELHLNLIDVILAIDTIFSEEIIQPIVQKTKDKQETKKKEDFSQCIFACQKAARLQKIKK